jgi:hypothetical protein
MVCYKLSLSNYYLILLGAIIFGGIDTKKYEGALEKRAIIPAAQAPDNFDRYVIPQKSTGLTDYYSYWIYMTSVGITKPDQTSKTFAMPAGQPNGQPVFLDSGGTLSSLPGVLANAIIAEFPGATQSGTSGLYIVNCALASQPGALNFGFGSKIIKVPYHEFIWQPSPGVCVIGVYASETSFVLGGKFS